MSATSPAGPAPARTTDRIDVDSSHGSGWVAFCGTMLAIVGTLNVIYGVGAIDDANVYISDTQYVFGDLNAWGWFLVIIGAVQVLAAFSIWSRTEWGRWVGIGSAGANAMLQLLFMPAFPLLSLALFAIDVLVIYGLIQYGGESVETV